MIRKPTISEKTEIKLDLGARVNAYIHITDRLVDAIRFEWIGKSITLNIRRNGGGDFDTNELDELEGAILSVREYLSKTDLK